MNVKRGELYYADLSPVVGSEQGGIRPVLVVQNDVGNKYSPTIIAAAVTSKINKAKLPTHIELPSAYGLAKDSVILLEQIRTIDKRRLKERIGELPPSTMNRVNKAILISLGFTQENFPLTRCFSSSSPIPRKNDGRSSLFLANNSKRCEAFPLCTVFIYARRKNGAIIITSPPRAGFRPGKPK